MKISNAITRAKRFPLDAIIHGLPDFITVQMAIDKVNLVNGIHPDTKAENIDRHATYSWGEIYDELLLQKFDPYVSHHGTTRIVGFRRAG